jgi:hypothetical protein
VRTSIEALPSGNMLDKNETMTSNDIGAQLAPAEDVRGKLGTVLTCVQPVWEQNVSQGDQTLNQYEVDIDGVGARLIIEEWLESTEK